MPIDRANPPAEPPLPVPDLTAQPAAERGASTPRATRDATEPGSALALPAGPPAPSSPPVYRSRSLNAPKRHASRGRIASVLDSVFAGIAVALAFWFAAVLLLTSIELSWWSILSLVAFWVIFTYLALPRLHQLMTTIYIPDYFLARTKTGDGLFGDPVNLAICGSADDIQALMQRAHWTKADEITLRSSLGIIKSSVFGGSYPEAPVSSLFLFDRKQDFAFQQEVDGSAAQRHHVRFWRTPDDWALPGGARADFLAAGTYDKGVGLTAQTLQFTHKIDEDVDAERDYVIESMRYIDPSCPLEIMPSFSSPFHDRNGGGDAIFTDGSMPILDVRGAAERVRAREAAAGLPAPSTALEPTASNRPVKGDAEVLDKELPPRSLALAGVVLALQLVLVVVAGSLFGLVAADLSQAETEETVPALVELGISVLLQVVLYVFTLKHHAWARLILLIVSALSAIIDLAQISVADHVIASNYIQTGLTLMLVLILSAPEVRNWTGSLWRRGDAARSAIQR